MLIRHASCIVVGPRSRPCNRRVVCSSDGTAERPHLRVPSVRLGVARVPRQDHSREQKLRPGRDPSAAVEPGPAMAREARPPARSGQGKNVLKVGCRSGDRAEGRRVERAAGRRQREHRQNARDGLEAAARGCPCVGQGRLASGAAAPAGAPPGVIASQPRRAHRSRCEASRLCARLRVHHSTTFATTSNNVKGG
jgi:hypothetical protein